jgi:hypothetical protein
MFLHTLLKATMLVVFAHSFASNETPQETTLRILKVSRSLKTILVNKGVSDGLQVGQHAIFANENATLARGVVLEATERRSLWGLYRVSWPTLMKPDTLMSMTATNPIKLTDDETRSLGQSQAEGLSGQELAPPLTSNAEGELPSNLLGDEENALPIEDHERELIDRHWMVLARGSIMSLSSSTSAGGNTYEGSSEFNQLLFGIEGRWKRLSLMPYYQYQTLKALSYEGAASETYSHQGGMSLQVYLKDSVYAEFLPYLCLNAGTGIVEDRQANGERSSRNGLDTSVVKGMSTSYSAGLGSKIILPSRVMVDFNVDYYFRSDEFDADNSTANQAWTRTLSGPRIQIGLGYLL